MSASDSKSAPIDMLLQQENLKLYKHRLVEKKAHLMKAQKAHQAATSSLDEYKTRIGEVLDHIKDMDSELAGMSLGAERDKLLSKKRELQISVEQANKNLAPYIARLDKLAVDIKELDEEVRRLSAF